MLGVQGAKKEVMDPDSFGLISRPILLAAQDTDSADFWPVINVVVKMLQHHTWHGPIAVFDHVSAEKVHLKGLKDKTQRKSASRFTAISRHLQWIWTHHVFVSLCNLEISDLIGQIVQPHRPNAAELPQPFGQHRPNCHLTIWTFVKLQSARDQPKQSFLLNQNHHWFHGHLSGACFPFFQLRQFFAIPNKFFHMDLHGQARIKVMTKRVVTICLARCTEAIISTLIKPLLHFMAIVFAGRAKAPSSRL
jgi:hypothetical protein